MKAAQTRYYCANAEAGSPHQGKWLVRAGAFPFDAPGKPRWTRLHALAALFETPEEARKAGGRAEAVRINPYSGLPVEGEEPA